MKIKEMKMNNKLLVEIEKIKSGIPGLDFILNGGLPKNRTTLISGTSGSAKTVLASQFLAEGIIQFNEHAVFITFEESPEDIRRNVTGLGWDIKKWEKEGKWIFVDGSPSHDEELVLGNNYDLGALLARIEYAINKIKARRISVDSIGTIFNRFKEKELIRNEIYKINMAFKKMGVTGIITAERTHEYGEISRYGVEEFVSDNVIVLRNTLENEKRRRTIEILKIRGAKHQHGEYPFTIVSNEGIVIIPLSAMELNQKSSNIKIKSGNDELDVMCGGGFFRDSIILISGATGCGKTLMVAEFINGGYKNGEKGLIFAFEESREQIFRNARSWGIDLKEMEKKGKLKVICVYPESKGLEDHLVSIKKAILEFKPDRLALDSLTALERIGSLKGFTEFVIAVTSFVKTDEITGIFTSTTSALTGGTSIIETHILTITDSIILLRYIEAFGEMRRCINILKMRGTMHEKNIREYIIDNQGMHIGNPFKKITGILAGNTMYSNIEEIDCIDDLSKKKK
jgi:circadian clock protein KaiC